MTSPQRVRPITFRLSQLRRRGRSRIPLRMSLLGVGFWMKSGSRRRHRLRARAIDRFSKCEFMIACPPVLVPFASSSACSAPSRFVSFAFRWRGTGETPVLQHSRDGYAPFPFPLCVFPRVLCAFAFRFIRLHWRRTGWKPVFHDRQEACLRCPSGARSACLKRVRLPAVERVIEHRDGHPADEEAGDFAGHQGDG